MFWRTYNGRVDGLLLKGDQTVPPTTWFNRLWLRFRVWKVVSILAVPPSETAYRVGFIPEKGSAMYLTKVLSTHRFAVLHGFEDCRFFAVDLEGTELPLEIVERTTADRVPEGVSKV